MVDIVQVIAHQTDDFAVQCVKDRGAGLMMLPFHTAGDAFVLLRAQVKVPDLALKLPTNVSQARVLSSRRFIEQYIS